MTSKFSIFMVCPSVMLSCLAMLALAVPGNMGFQPGKKSASPDHEKVENWLKNFDLQAAREAVEFDCIKAMERIFKTVRTELVKVPLRNKKECGKEPKHDSSDIDTAYTETIATWRDLLDVLFSNIPSYHPLASSKIKNETIHLMMNLADAVYTGINVTSNIGSSPSLTELSCLQKKAACSLSGIGSSVYADMRLGHEYDARTNAVVDCHRENTLSDGVTAVSNMFHGIRILMATIDSTAKTEIEDELSLLADLLKESDEKCRDWTKNIFDSVDLLCRVHLQQYV